MIKIEEVDQIPVIMHILLKMQIDSIIDRIWPSHGNRQGLSHGQLAVLFITYVIHMLNHRFSYMESWVIKHKTVLEEVSGWHIGDKDATDDRIGVLAGRLGGDSLKLIEFQRVNGQNIISAYELPTECARYDTTSFNVYHLPENNNEKILQFGHSKDNRPDLLQFKQGIGTLDPAGVPIFTETLAGNCADDPRYVPVWREMADIIGHTGFIYVADCKAASLENRAIIDKEGGFYLFPLPMTGKVPEELKKYIMERRHEAEEIILIQNSENDFKEIENTDINIKHKVIGIGFEIKEIAGYEKGNETHKWEERRLIVRSDAYAGIQIKSLETRLEKAYNELARMKAKKGESADQFRLRADKIIDKYYVTGCIEMEIKEIEMTVKNYLTRGRPGPDTPYKTITHKKPELSFKYMDRIIEEKKALAGWRIFVTNTPEKKLSLRQSVSYYRDEWLVERGMHRFKKGSLPVLPLFLRIPERIKGLMLLLTIALQVLTLMEFVIRRELSESGGILTGLVPGNPKMKTARPTAERIISQFKGLHCLIEETEGGITGYIVEELTVMQKHILTLLKIPHDIYKINFSYKLLHEVT